MVADTTIADVLITLISTVPAILAAVFAGLVALRTNMRNGTKIGHAVEQTHAHSIENNALLRKLNNEPAAGES